MSGPLDILKVQDASPLRDLHMSAIGEVKDAAESGKAADVSLSDIVGDADKAQSEALLKTLRAHVKAGPRDFHDPATEVRIGLTWMTVPPDSIRINETRYNDNIPGLRTSSSALVKTGRGQIRIDLQLNFPDKKAINKELRQIIAQFRASPFLPVESDYIYNAVIAYAANIDAKAVDDAKLKIERTYLEYIKTQREMVDVITGSPSLLRVAMLKYSTNLAGVRTRMETKLPNELVTEVADLIARPEEPLVGLESVDKALRLSSFVGTTKWLDEIAERARELLVSIQDLHAELLQLGVPEASRRPIVPVVLHTLEAQTVPNERDSMTVRLSLIYFNHTPYVSEMMYKDVMGGEALDILDCPSFDWYVRSRFLEGVSEGEITENISKGERYLGKVGSTRGMGYTFKYPVPKFEEVDDDEPRANDLVPRIPARMAYGRAMNLAGKADNKAKKLRAKTERLYIWEDHPNLVPAQVAIVLQNRVALQPVTGAMYGTAQHVGALNARITVTFAAVGNVKSEHDKAVAKIHRMKREVERVASIGGPRIRRNTRIQVWNDILSLFGVRYVQIDNVATRTMPGEIFSSMVRLDMTEYTVSQEQREALRLAKPDSRMTLLEAAFSFGADAVDAYLKGKNTLPKGALTADSGPGPYCYKHLYGSGAEPITLDLTLRYGFSPAPPGVITTDVMTDVLANKLEIRKAIERSMYERHLSHEEVKRVKSLPRGHWAAEMPRETSLGSARAVSPPYTPTDTAIHAAIGFLAKEMIQFWTEPKVAVGNIATAESRRDSRDVITIESKPDAYLKDILDTLKKRGFEEEYERLQTFADYAMDNFPSVKEYVKDRMKDSTGISNYPDLDLPTYMDVFFGAAADNVTFGVSRKASRVFATKYTGSLTKDVLKRFMPTFRDLGKTAPIDMDPYDIAVNLYDHVAPDFFYYHMRRSEQFDSYAEEIKDDASRIYSPSKNVFNPTKATTDKYSLAQSARVRTLKQATFEDDNLYIDSGDRDGAIANMDLVPGDTKPAAWRCKGGTWSRTAPKPGYGTTPEHGYAPGDPRMLDAVGKYVHDDPKHLEGLFRETVGLQKDDTERMLRAFPTFRLSFIELDNEEWGYWDDFYAYSAVIDIKLSQHKFEPELLEIRLINVTGNLDEMRAHVEDPDRLTEASKWTGPDGAYRDSRPPIGSGEVEEGTGEKRTLDKFYLQTGTNVELRLGYGSQREDLEIKFTGQIVEIQQGDVITLLCQGYKNQLTVPLNTYRDGKDTDVHDIIKWVMNESPTTHFGEWSPHRVLAAIGSGSLDDPESTEHLGWGGYRRTEAKRMAQKAHETGAAAGTIKGYLLNRLVRKQLALVPGYNPIANAVDSAMGKAATWIAELVSTRKMSNVYVAKRSGLAAVFRWKGEFLIPDRTGLEVLHELTRHLPGYVFDVRPYDHRATLFFGKPEQRYFYTSEKMDEERMWRQFRREAQKESEDLFVRIIVGFEDSIEGRAVKQLEEDVNSRVRDKKSVRLLGSLPGRSLGFLTIGLIGRDAETVGAQRAEIALTGYRKSPDRSSELRMIEEHLGTTHVKALACYFFNKLSPKYHGMGIFSIATDAWEIIKVEGAVQASFEMGAVGHAQLSPGSILVSLQGWREKVTDITALNEGTVESYGELRYGTFGESEERRFWNVTRDEHAGVIDAMGQQIPRELYEETVQIILDHIESWKNYVWLLSEYIQRKMKLGDTELFEQTYISGRKVERVEHNPRTKKFRAHHYVDARQHIIKNNIVATKEQMANTVIVKYPVDITPEGGHSGGRYWVSTNTSWESLEWQADENTLIGEKKVRLITEINAEEYHDALLTVWSNLAEALRPMYRGDLHLRGDERINPHDIVWIYDPYENMYGPVEVERVITHFNSETGFTTTIIPQLLAVPMSYSGWLDAIVCGQMNATKSLLAVERAHGIGKGIPHLAGGPGAATGAALYQDYKLGEETHAGIWGNLTGKGRYGNMRTPVDIIPLVKNGIPWTAGLKGWGDGNWKLRLFKRWANFKRGSAVAWEASKPLRDKILSLMKE